MAKQSMDLFGEALKAHAQGNKDKFYFQDKSGKIFEHSLKRYFRKSNQISKLEKKLISLSYGDILDVGCGTGNYMTLLAKKGRVLGIDISKKAVEAAKILGCKNCVVADIYSFPVENKFDTITLLENNFGIGGSVARTKLLLKKFLKMLKNDGQILAIVRGLSNKKYFIAELRPIWNKKIGSKFSWIHFNMDFLGDLCKKEGLCFKILQGNQYSYLIRIVKNETQKSSH